MDYVKLSKTISYALRHAPWEYELELDEQGWVDISQLLYAFNEEEGWCNVKLEDILHVVSTCAKKRFEVDGNRIRALYGHSLPQKIVKSPEEPPRVLFHGTPRQNMSLIQEKGLIPKGRQYVHLSADTQIALQVGKRRDKEPMLLKIDAQQAWNDGVKFYRGNDRVWLADCVLGKYIQIVDQNI